MSKAIAQPDGWSVINVLETPRGEYNLWENSDGEQIMLNKGTLPNRGTLDMLAANGVVPKHPDETTETAPGDAQFIPVDEEPELEETAVDRILSALRTRDTNPDARSEVRISRIPEMGVEIYCCKITAAEFEEQDLEYIQKNFGPGKYRIKVMGTTPRFDADQQPIKHGGKFISLLNQVVEIAAPLSSAKPGEVNPAHPVHGPLLTTIDRMQAELVQLRSGPKPPTMLEQMQMFQMMQQVFGNAGGGGKNKSLIEQLEEMKRIKDLIPELGGGGGDNAPDMMTMGMKFLETIGPALNKPNPAPQIAGPIAPVAIPESFNTSDEPQEEDDVNAFQHIALRSMVNALCKKASENAEIGPIADSLVDQLPDEIIDMMESPIWFDTITEMFPQIAPHQIWFTQLRDAIIVLLDAEDEPEVAPAAPLAVVPKKGAGQPGKG